MATKPKNLSTLPDTLEPVSVFEKATQKHFQPYEVTLVGTAPLCGGIPSDPNMIKGWLVRNAGVVKGDVQHKQLIIETVESLGYPVEELQALADRDYMELVDKATEIMMKDSKVVQFARTKLGELALANRNVKAMVKESAAIVFPNQFFEKATGNRLTNLDTKRGKTLKSLVSEWLYVDPRWIGLGVTEPTEVRQQVGHTSTGAHLSMFETVEEWEISFRILVLHDLIKDEIWPEIFGHAELNGLGANRSMGYGTFKTTRFDKK